MAQASGFSRGRLRRMSEVMRGFVERGESAGILTLLWRHGQVHVDASGVQDLESAVPISAETLFRIASMTKPITAVAAMILVEQAKIRLDDPLLRWLPELSHQRVLRTLHADVDDTVPIARPITLRDLLTFRLGSGMLFGPELLPIQRAQLKAQILPAPDSPMLEPDAWIERFGRLPLMHQPGEQWMYHSGSEVLSVLIARVSGMPFADFLERSIFKPLGMKDTAFVVPEPARSRLAAVYEWKQATGKLERYAEREGPLHPAGGTGLISTVADYLAFGRMMLQHGRFGGERILSRPTVQVMTTDQLTFAQKAASPFFPNYWDSHGWGFGVSIVTARDSISAVPGRYGWDGAYGTSWFSDPHEDLVAILMTQRVGNPLASQINTDFRTLVYQAIDD